MVDIHSHILPGIDDGADSWEAAVEMCRLASADGITQLVATPHANSEYPYNRGQFLSLLGELREKSGGVPELSLGCDLHFSFDNLQQLLTDASPYTIGATDYVLIELSEYGFPAGLKLSFQQLMAVGLRPIITHPERNLLLQYGPEPLLEWAELGVVIQVTANSLTGFWGKPAQKTVRWLLDRNAVHVVASDAHDVKDRPPLLSRARDVIADWKDEDLALALVDDNPGAIVRGEELPYFPPPKK